MSYFLQRPGHLEAIISQSHSEIGPAELFGGSLIHRWDFSRGVTIATGISQIDDLVGTNSDHLVQATGANQPAYTSAGQLSFSTGDGTDNLRKVGVAVPYAGDLTIIAIGRWNAAENTTLLSMGATAAVGRTRIYAAGGLVAAGVGDATGLDVFAGPSRDTNNHMFVLRNAVGSARKLYVDGGAGYSGARTDAIETSNNFALHSFANNTAPSQTSLYEVMIVSPSPTVSLLNELWREYIKIRYASLGFTWASAS